MKTAIDVDLPALVVATRHPEYGANKWKEWGWSCPDVAQATLLRDVPDEKQPLSTEGVLHCNSHAERHYLRYGPAGVVVQAKSYRAQSLGHEQFKWYKPSELRAVQVMTTPLLNERSYGKVWGMTEEEVHAKFPGLKDKYEQQGPFRGSFPGGNSLKDVFDNMKELSLLFPAYAGKKVFLNCHMGNILALRALLEDWSEEDVLKALNTAIKDIPNCSATSYVWDASSRSLVLQDKYYPL